MSILEQLVKEYAAMKHTGGVTGVHSNPNVHGPNSLFGVPGLSRDVISSRVTSGSLAGALPARGDVYKLPMFPYITGKNAPSGTQVANSCTPAPISGSLNTCIQTAQFGLYQFRTRELELNTVGALVNHGEATDLRFVNDPLAMQMGQIFLQISDKDMALRAGREVLMRFVEVGMDFEEILSRQIYEGTGLTNEFPGLEILVSTVHYDAKTGTLCGGLASDVRDFGDVDITTSAGAAALVTELVDMYRKARYNSQTQGFDPATWKFIMREQLFNRVSEVWPCAFLTSGCIPTNSNVSVNVNSDAQINMRVDMMASRYLLIDGIKVPVITDNYLAETDLGGNVFSSDVYLLPFTVRGGREVLYWQYFDYNRGMNQAITDGRLAGSTWIDNGRYAVAKLSQVIFCNQWQLKVEPRIILEVPQLAGRLMNVATSLTTHYNDPGADGSSIYQVNTGVSGYAPDSLYNNWDNIPT